MQSEVFELLKTPSIPLPWERIVARGNMLAKYHTRRIGMKNINIFHASVDNPDDIKPQYLVKWQTIPYQHMSLIVKAHEEKETAYAQYKPLLKNLAYRAASSCGRPHWYDEFFSESHVIFMRCFYAYSKITIRFTTFLLKSIVRHNRYYKPSLKSMIKLPRELVDLLRQGDTASEEIIRQLGINRARVVLAALKPMKSVLICDKKGNENEWLADKTVDDTVSDEVISAIKEVALSELERDSFCAASDVRDLFPDGYANFVEVASVHATTPQNVSLIARKVRKKLAIAIRNRLGQ